MLTTDAVVAVALSCVPRLLCTLCDDEDLLPALEEALESTHVVAVHAQPAALRAALLAAEGLCARPTDLLTLCVVAPDGAGEAALADARARKAREAASLAVAAPKQSGEMGAPEGRRLLTALRCPGASRRDEVEALDAAQVASLGCEGAVRLDSVLAAVAYKLGRAPKYGRCERGALACPRFSIRPAAR